VIHGAPCRACCHDQHVSDDRPHFGPGELRRRTARGGAINGAFLGGAEALVLAQGLIVTALLGPVAIGLYGVVTTTAMTLVALKRVGIDEAFVQQSEAAQEEEFQRAFSIELGLAVLLAVTIAVAAPVLALAYGEESLLPLTLAVAYLPVAFALQSPGWIFYRRMDFLRQRLLQGVVPLVTFAVTVPLAVAGVGVWSLVIGPFAGNAIGVAAAMRLSPYRLRLRFDRATARRYLTFSWPIFLAAGAALVVQGGQVFAFDLEGGIAAAGFITLAATLTRYADRADQIVATTIYPAVCAVRHRRAVLEELFTKSNRLTLAWTLPFCASIGLFAGDLVELVLGEEWRPAVVLLQGLAVAAGLQQLGYNWFAFYRARGESRPQAVESAVMLAGFLALAVPGLFLWGFEGFVAGRVAGTVLVLAVRRSYIRRLLPGVRTAALTARAAVPVAAAALVVLVLREGVWSGDRTAARAVVELVAFGGLVAAVTWWLERDLLRELGAYARPGGVRAPAVAGTEPLAPASV